MKDFLKFRLQVIQAAKDGIISKEPTTGAIVINRSRDTEREPLLVKKLVEYGYKITNLTPDLDNLPEFPLATACLTSSVYNPARFVEMREAGIDINKKIKMVILLYIY